MNSASVIRDTLIQHACFPSALDALDALDAERNDAIKTLEMIADADYRGNRSAESVTAYLFLKSVGLRD